MVSRKWSTRRRFTTSMLVYRRASLTFLGGDYLPRFGSVIRRHSQNPPWTHSITMDATWIFHHPLEPRSEEDFQPFLSCSPRYHSRDFLVILYWQKIIVFGWFWFISDGVPPFFEREIREIGWRGSIPSEDRCRLLWIVGDRCIITVQQKHPKTASYTMKIYKMSILLCISLYPTFYITIMSIMSEVYHRSYQYITTMWAV